MYIKKHKNKNEYVPVRNSLARGVWVRNFTKKNVVAKDISQMIETKEYNMLLSNEKINATFNLNTLDIQDFYFPKIVIVSDGYDFKNKQDLLASLPKDVVIFAVNKALLEWTLVEKKRINLYVVNNPYAECLNFLPRKMKYYPSCILSSRTNPDFVRQYKGAKYEYIAVPHEKFNSNRHSTEWHVDDYRNPICGSIGIAYRFGVQKLLLFCCDDSFANERSASVELKNGLWMYPHQQLSHDIIDANLHWLTNQENHRVEVRDHSSGPDYKNAAYISADNVIDFFED